MTLSKHKKALDTLLSLRNAHNDLPHDPLSFVHRYSTKEDQEIAGVFASALAYGRVTLFFPVIRSLLDEADAFGGPRAWIDSFSRKHMQRISSIYYRLNKAPDFSLLALGMQGICTEHDSLFQCFAKEHKTTDSTYMEALDRFLLELQTHALQKAKEYNLCSTLPKSFLHMLPRPSSGSACKRWQLYLRWMIRKEFPDMGIWPLESKKLLIPLDTHVHQISRMIGLCSRKSADLKTAKEITKHLQELDEEDPIRYDFAIAHMGISGQCQKKHVADICNSCSLSSICIMESS